MLQFFEKPGVLIVLLVALIVFGAKRLPDSARSLGRSMRILKSEVDGLKDDESSTRTEPSVSVPTPTLVAGAAPLPDPATIGPDHGHQRV